MELTGRRNLWRRLWILEAAALFLFFAPAPSAASSPRFHLTFGASAFLPSQSLLRDLYGSPLLGLQAQASVRFAGGWSVFAGYRSIRAEGEALGLGSAIESEPYRVRMDLSSVRGGVGYGWSSGRWTFSAAAGAAWLVCKETWPEAGLAADKSSFGVVLAAGADVSIFGPLGLFTRLEIGPTQRKDDILLGGFDAVGGLSLRF